MILTGKTKIKFNKWFANNKILENGIDLYQEIEFNGLTNYKYLKFEQLPFSMQYGVMVDFFDSKGIRININSYDDGNEWQYDIDTESPFYDAKSRPEARIEAIKKANEILNNKL